MQAAFCFTYPPLYIRAVCINSILFSIMIIITGGAGFIGSAMLWELNCNGEEDIIVVDDLGSTTTEKWRNLSGLHFTDFISKDLFPDLLERNALKGISSIIHMGANSSTTETDAVPVTETLTPPPLLR